MAKIDTRELIKEYCEAYPEDICDKTKAQWDRPDLYAYEQKIGKRLVDMNEQEAKDMFRSFKTKGGDVPVSRSSIGVALTWYKKIVDYYAETYEPKHNIFHTKGMRLNVIVDYINQQDGAQTFADVERLISGVRDLYDDGKADFCECLIWLYYCGFYRPERIIKIKKDNIDFEALEINFSDGVSIKLNQRCAYLLKKVHHMELQSGVTNVFSMEHWQGSYLRFPFRTYNDNRSVDDLSDTEVAKKLNTCLTRWITRPQRSSLTALDIFYIGFYDYLVEKHGAVRANELILNKGNAEDNNEMKREILLRGIKNSTNNVKNNLRKFVKR